MTIKSGDRTDRFQHMVLNALWILILLGFGKQPRKQAQNFQSSAIHFGDEFGNQGDKAKEYRREITYWGQI